MSRIILGGVLALLIISLIQEESLFSISVGGVKPDLWLIFVLSFALQWGMVAGGVAGLVVGFFQGAALGMAVGTALISKTVTGLVCGQIEPHIVKNSVVVCLLIAWLGTWVCEITFALFYPRVGFGIWAKTAAAESFFNAALAPLIYFPLLWLLGSKERGNAI